MNTTIKLLSLCLLSLSLVGCNTTTFERTAQDGSKLTVRNNRVFWSTENYNVEFDATSAKLSAFKSSVDSQAIAAVAEGVAKGLKP